jgi:hypothetical protein
MTETKITGLLFKLADLGVTGLLVTYSGGGGDYQIDDIVYTVNKLDADDNRAINELDSISTYSPTALHLDDLDIDINSDLHDFVLTILLYDYDIPNWVKDDGGYGAVSILIPSGKYRIVNTIYITETDTSIHSGNLLSKTED